MSEEIKKTYEQKKEDKERAREKERKAVEMRRTKKIIKRYGIGIIVIALIIYGIVLLAQANAPQGPDFSIPYQSQGRSHIADGAPHAPYNSNPPSSGPHYATTARGGFYDAPLPDERVVHNLEHGDIWIAYRPGLDDDIKSALESFAGTYVVVSPRAENEGDISLVAWGRVDTFDVEDGILDKERIKDFIKRYDNRGPENVRTVQSGHSGL